MSIRRNRKNQLPVKALRKCSSKRRSAATRQPSGYEQLEQRQLLATFVVNSAGDDASGATDGMLSLREAVIASSTNASFGDAVAGDATGDVIRFDSSLAGQTISLTNGQLNVTDDLMIQGGMSNITIDAGGLSRIFNIATGQMVSIGRLTLANGQSVQGGAISAAGAGTTTLFEVNFTGNTATGIGGGAIYNVDDTMYVSGSTFVGNTASGASGSGGAVLSVAGTTAFVNSTFQQNTANRAGGAIETIDGTIFLTDSTIGGTGNLGNVAGPVGSAAPGNGGGLHVTASAGIGVYLNNTDVIGNYAAREGGGLWNSGSATMSVRNGSLVASNTAAGNDDTRGGGGIFNNGGDVNLIDSEVSGNTASGTSGNGGGLMTTAGTVYLNNATVSGNVANRAGGGIEAVNGLTFIRNSRLGGAAVADGNIAGPAGSAAPGNGGGLHVTGGSARVVLEGGSLVSNNVAAREGGGLWNQAGSTMIIRGNTTISNNSAGGNAADDGGGGIFSNGGLTLVNDSTISANAATGTNGSGGGIFAIGGNTQVTNSTVTANTAAFAGGGLAVSGGGFLKMTNSTVGGTTTGQGNVAGNFLASTTGLGGGIYLTGNGTATVISNTDIDNNTATTSGGGIHLALGSYARVEGNSSVSFNRATLPGAQGGGVYSAARFRAIDTAFEGNIATLAGGGLYISDSGSARVDNSAFMANDGGQQGGGIFNDNLLQLDDSTVTLNMVSDTGGGIYTSAGKTSIVNNTNNTGNLPNNTN